MIKPARAASGRTDDVDLHYEGPAVDTRGTLFWAAVVVATVVVSGAVSHEIYSKLMRPTSERSGTPLYGEGLVLPAEPRLEGIEMMSAASTNNATTEEDRLQKFGWVNREKKIVRIPIQKAMELAIEQDWLRSTPRDNHLQPADNAKPADKNHLAP